MSGRALIVANTAYMIRQFNMGNIRVLQEMGYDVDVACNFEQGNPVSRQIIDSFRLELGRLGVEAIQIPVVKSLRQIGANYAAYRQLLGLMKRKNYALVHSQTPVGGVIARLAAHKARTPVIYMAHGFHFHKRSGRLAWLLYYPVEKALSRITDALILINQEDYRLARERMKAHRTYYVPGVGIDLSPAQPVHRPSRKEIGVPEDAFLLLSVGELNKNKNHEAIIRILPGLPGVHYVIAGEGELRGYLTDLAKQLGVADRVHLIGFRSDIRAIYGLADLYCHPSFREGLSVAIMEAMAEGLPVVCSRIRGNEDLIVDGYSGLLVTPISSQGFAEAVQIMIEHPSTREKISRQGLNAIQQYDMHRVQLAMQEIYASVPSVRN